MDGMESLSGGSWRFRERNGGGTEWKLLRSKRPAWKPFQDMLWALSYSWHYRCHILRWLLHWTPCNLEREQDPSFPTAKESVAFQSFPYNQYARRHHAWELKWGNYGAVVLCVLARLAQYWQKASHRLPLWKETLARRVCSTLPTFPYIETLCCESFERF